jgi:hypothetical protein
MCMVTVQWLDIFCIQKFGQTGLEMSLIVKITSTLMFEGRLWRNCERLTHHFILLL